MTKTKIAFIHNSTHISGAEISLMQLIEGLDRDQYAPEVVLPSQGDLFLKLKERVPVHVVPMKRLRRTRNPLKLIGLFFHSLRVIYHLIGWIRRHQPDVIHANVSGVQIYAGLAGRLTRRRVVWHVRDLIPRGFLVSRLASLSSAIVCNSRCTAQTAGLDRHRKTRIIANGIPPFPAEEAPRLPIRKHYHLPPDQCIVAMIGQLIPWKRHLDLILAADGVVKEFPKVSFLIVGSDLFGEYDGYVDSLTHAIASRGLKEHFVFTGPIENIGEFISQIDILCHPARQEPFGRVVVESMLAGKAVVAVNQCGPADIIEHETSGFLSEPGNIEEMTSFLLALLKNPALRISMGKAGQARAREKYSLLQHVRQIESLYDELTRT